MDFLKSYYFKPSGEKLIFNKKNAVTSVIALLLVGFACYIAKEIFFSNSAILIKTSEPVKESTQDETRTDANLDGMKYLITPTSESPPPRPKGKNVLKESFKLKAPQVIDLSGHSLGNQSNTFGATIKVRLLNDIDTREPEQICKVEVIESTILELPIKSLLFGKATLGLSKRVLIQFDRALLPHGEDADLLAQAIDLKTNKLGVEGNFYGRNGLRALGSMSLNMISGVSETLTQKESLGGFQGQVANKPTLKNSIFNGIAKTSESEALRQSENLNSLPEYAELKHGSVFSLQLLEKVKIQ